MDKKSVMTRNSRMGHDLIPARISVASATLPHKNSADFLMPWTCPTVVELRVLAWA